MNVSKSFKLRTSKFRAVCPTESNRHVGAKLQFGHDVRSLTLTFAKASYINVATKAVSSEAGSSAAVCGDTVCVNWNTSGTS